MNPRPLSPNPFDPETPRVEPLEHEAGEQQRGRERRTCSRPAGVQRVPPPGQSPTPASRDRYGYAGPMPPELYHRPSHEPLAGAGWSEAAARAAIAAIAADAEAAFDPDAVAGAPARRGRRAAAAGRRSALPGRGRRDLGAGRARAAPDAVELRARLGRRRRRRCPTATLADPDLPEWTDGKAGAVAARGRVGHPARRPPAGAPAASQVERMLECVARERRTTRRASCCGARRGRCSPRSCCSSDRRRAAGRTPGASRRTGSGTSGATISGCRSMYGRALHYIGPGHGFAGNVHVLARGDLLDAAGAASSSAGRSRRCAAYADRDGGLAQWPPTLEPRAGRSRIRTQWCHGAPGHRHLVRRDRSADDDELTELLRRRRRADLARRARWSRGPASATAPPATATRS